MIPAPVVGAAILTLIWMALWWLVGGRRELRPLGCRATACAWGVLALHEAAHFQQLLLSVLYLAFTIEWSIKAVLRQQAEHRLRSQLWYLAHRRHEPTS